MSDTTSTPTPNSTDPSTSVAVAASSSTATNSSLTTTSTNAGAIAGGVVGGVVVLALLILGLILFRRARRRRHIAPSSEFAETIKRGEMPVLRLDSGMEIVPSAPTHHVPLPLRRDSYHTSPVMSDIKLPDTTMGSDTQSVRFSLEKPLQPLRYPVQQDSNDSMSHAAPRVSSIGSSQELWSRDSGRFDTRKDLRSQSPLSVTADTGYSSLTQNTYPMEHSRTAETVPNAYTDLWKLSVAPISRRRPASAADAQALPPLIPVRRSVDVGRR
ncbi:uncharacterized protein EDB91DRAFT_830523 [Suillus paluster]|uniref:uncharacterized protein n=1 Tax=Suillus paluster TaxID=48578 RepID=UPI001B8805C5|nr:uncharacterized protein EDB91DRAFT_830523 [Suillus paluster]KAG1749030.1 hypothetical protein EDB91DRAFT_830523 [Suillus paluster]